LFFVVVLFLLTCDVSADPSRIALYESQADTELVKRVLATNVYVDQREKNPVRLPYY
jgi:hypothetical protein